MLIPICLLASWDSIKFLIKEFLVCFLALEIFLIVVFTTLDLLVFYISFEAVLIPMFFIIGIYGARQQKITAAYYFFFYTLVGSVLMLLAIFYLYSEVGATDYLTLVSNPVDEVTQRWVFLAFFSSLAVKIPKFPFHI
jgi:NADH:ubiquinone oxidoreductase subunit 4 (subunit M)